MISACILIRTERGRFQDVAKKLKQIKEVKRAFPVLGRFDIVADVEAADNRRLGRAVLKANRMAGIVFTETLPQVEGS
jgi:uncharacterized protein with GYD domain